MRDSRWRPASEPPEIPKGQNYVRVIVERHGFRGLRTQEAQCASLGIFEWEDAYWGRRPRPILDATRWRYWPEPPTPEQEERARLEREVIARLAGSATRVMHTTTYPEYEWTDAEWAFIRDLAKGGDS